MAVLLVALAACLGAVAQAVTGFGFSLVCAPVLVSVVGARYGVATVNMVASLLNVLFLIGDHKHVMWRRAALLFLPAAVAAALAGWVVRSVDGRPLQILAGVITIVAALAVARGLRLDFFHGTVGAAWAGGVSGVMNTVGGVGGPPVALYSVHEGWPQKASRPTMQAYFLGLNVVSLASLGIPPVGGKVYAAFGGLAAGWIVGLALTSRLPAAVVRNAVFVMAVVGGAAAIVRGVLR